MAKQRLCNIRSRSKSAGIPFNLDDNVERFVELCSRKVCAVSGIELTTHDQHLPTHLHIDRVIPADGYIWGNVRPVCAFVNLALGDWGSLVARKVLAQWINRNV